MTTELIMSETAVRQSHLRTPYPGIQFWHLGPSDLGIRVPTQLSNAQPLQSNWFARLVRSPTTARPRDCDKVLPISGPIVARRHGVGPERHPLPRSPHSTF
jgi:hypothetical protein